MDRYTSERNETSIIKSPIWLNYRFGNVKFFEDLKKDRPDLVWYADQGDNKSINYDGGRESLTLIGNWKAGEIQKLILALLVKELGKNDLFLFHGSVVRYRGLNVMFMTGEENHGKTMCLMESARRGGKIISCEGSVLDRDGHILQGTSDVFLNVRLEGTERSDKPPPEGWEIFFDSLPEFKRVEGKIGDVDLVVLPSIDGHFDTVVTKLEQFEKEYQTFSCLSLSYFLSHELISSKIPAPIIEDWDLRLKRARFTSGFALKRPYFLVRAKGPQIVLDEVDNIIDELNKE
ncbi:MAG: hypothetical protein JSW24_00445 [Dehalococcoidia bacterium]|nr:MAG: hypothetical protein JSW24_00445 [Dehalococcoidia bacterium]